MFLDKLTQEQLELALQYLVDSKQLEPPPSLPELNLLEWLAVNTTGFSFWYLGKPRFGKDDNPSLGTGAYALDQSWHYLWLFVCALILAA